MSTGEDEPSSSVNGRLRPRKSTSTTTPSPQNTTARKTEGKLAQDRTKKNSTPSKASPPKQDDLVTKSESASSAPLYLCPYCDRKFIARQTASKHARRIHLSSTKQDNFIKCLYCNHSDAESNVIIKHMVDSHPNQYFACLDCHTRFPSTTELAEHKHNICEKQKPPYRSKLRQKTVSGAKKNKKKSIKSEKTKTSNESTHLTDDISFNGIVISCELKPSDMHADAVDIEDKITTNLILPSSKALGNTPMEKNAVIVLDDLQWNKRIPPNFSFHNSDADQILSRLGVVHRSPRVGESRKDLVRIMDESNEKFERCFDTHFYSRVAKNVQENLAKYLDGTFNFNPNKDVSIKTRKSKASVIINTAEGFPILLAQEQFSRNLFDGFIPRAMAPKHKWKWGTTENDKNLVMLLDQTKRDSHVNNCIVTLISSLDIWTQLRMKSKFEDIFKTTPTAKKAEKQNIISSELKEILESRVLPSSSSQVVQTSRKPVHEGAGSELTTYLGLAATSGESALQPAVLSGEWVRPRCYVCCACGDQTRDARMLSAHLAAQHPNAQVQHYEIVGETLLSADILKHLYVPPSQISNRTRPPRGFRDCTKCKKSVTLEDLHQHMLDCAGDTPTVRRKCRYRPFGVRRRRPRLPDNTIRKKIRKDMRNRHRQKSHMRPRPRIRTEVGDAETIRKMIADLPAKRNRITPPNVLKPRRSILIAKKQAQLRSSVEKKSKHRPIKNINKPKKIVVAKKQNDTDNSSTIDEDDQPLKLSATRVSNRTGNGKETRRSKIIKTKKKKQVAEMDGYPPNYHMIPLNEMYHSLISNHDVGRKHNLASVMTTLRPEEYSQYHCHYPTRQDLEQSIPYQSAMEQIRKLRNYTYNLHQHIDLINAGPSNIRQHSSGRGRNDNMQSGKGRSAGQKDSSNQNNNIAQAPKVPLKHSIASLTSHTEGRGGSMPYHHPYLITPEINATFIHELTDGRKMFENEATVEKVDKPPLSTNLSQSNSDEQRPASSSVVYNIGAYTSPPCDLTTSRRPILPPNLSNRQEESRAAVEQMVLYKESADRYACNEQQPFLEDFEESLKSANPLSVQKDSKESLRLNPEHKKANLNTETKVEKYNKNRRGLNDCIAMLRTKKGLRLDKASNDHGDIDDVDSDIIDLDVNEDFEVPRTVTSESPVSTSKNTKKNRNMTAQSSPIQDEGSTSGSLSISTDREHRYMQADNTNALQNKSAVDSDHASLNSKHYEYESNEIMSSNLTISKLSTVVSPVATQTDALPYPSLRSKQFVDDNSEATATQNMWRDSQEKNPIRQELKRFFYHKKVNDTVKTLIDFNIPNLTQAMLDAQAKLIRGKEDEIDMNLLHEYRRRIVVEMQKRQGAPESVVVIDQANAQAIPTSEQVVASTAQAVASAAQAISQITVSTDDLIDAKLPFRQSNVSPTSRRTRRKPMKKKANLEENPESKIEKSKAQKQMEVSPSPHDSRGIGKSPMGQNIRFYNSGYLSGVSPSHDTLSLKTPSPLPPPPPPPPISTRVRRDSCTRVFNSSDTNMGFENKDNVTQAISPEIQAKNIMSMHNLRRHSIELANAQAISANYDTLLAHAYREHYEQALLNISQTNRSISHTRKTSPEESNNDSVIYEKSSRYPYKSTYVSMTPDTHGIMHVNPNASTSDINITKSRELHDNYKTSYENEQFMFMNVHKQIPDNLKAKKNRSVKVNEKYATQESKSIKQKSSALDTTPQRGFTQSISDAYYISPVPYQSTHSSINTSSHCVDMEYNENKETHSNALRAYHESVASFAVPTATYSNDILQHSAISLIPPLLSGENNAEEMAPLDLSCDSKTRKDETLDLSKKSTNLSQSICNIPISNEKYSEHVPINENFRCNSSEQLRSTSKHTALLSESEPIDIHHLAPNVTLQMSEKDKNQEMCTPKLTHLQALSTTNTLCDSTQPELTNKSFNESNKSTEYNDNIVNQTVNSSDGDTYLIDQLPSTPRGCNTFLLRDIQIISFKTVSHPEKKGESPCSQNENITQSATQVNLEAKCEDETIKYASTNVVDHNVENIYEDTRTTFANISTSDQNDMQSHIGITSDVKSKETNDHISSQEVLTTQKNSTKSDYSQNELDAETARKFAMLPEEIVKILGTIPKNHCIQLLNVLPQYVSTPLTNIENDTKIAWSPAEGQKGNEPQIEANRNTSESDSIMLSVNTAFSPSSIVPKKRHSPAHSKGRLNSSESLLTEPMLLPSPAPTLSQHSPIESNESANELKSAGTDCLITTNNPGSKVPTAQKALEKDNTGLFTSALNEPFQSKKGNEGLAAVATVFPTTVPQAPTPKLHKSTNEQTASLRAVRIKTTSTKKTFLDDKKLFTNYSYTTNIPIDEKCRSSKVINTETKINPDHQVCNIKSNDLEYEISKSNSYQQIENNYCESDISSRDTAQRLDRIQGKSKDIERDVLSDTMAKDNVCLTRNIPQHVAISKDVNNILLHETVQEIDKSNNMLKRSSPKVSEETNSPAIDFLEHINSTTPSENIIPEDELSALQPKFSYDSESNKDTAIDGYPNDVLADVRLNALEETVKTSEIDIVVKCSDENLKVQPILPNPIKTLVAKETLSSDEPNTSVSPSDRNIKNDYKISSKNEKSNEDDSDDDETLAVIKQKHTNVDDSTRKNTSYKTSKKSAVSKSKSKKQQLNIVSKRQKVKMSVDIEMNQTKKFLNKNEDLDEFSLSFDTKNKSNEVTDDKRDDLTNMIYNAAVVLKVTKCDVNKENNLTENINKTNVIESTQIVEHGEIENVVDKSVNKDEQKIPSNTKIDMDNLLPLENDIIRASEQMPQLSDLNITPNVGFDKTCVAIEDCHSNGKQIMCSNNELRNNILPDMAETELDLFSPSMKDTKLEEDIKESTEITNKDATKIDPLAKLISSIPSDFVLCSEISDVNTVPLRRSRRGKSTYVDSSYLQDSEEIQDFTKKAPLTMKRLILSRVEKDKRNSESSIVEKSCDDIEDNLLINSEEPEAPNVVKRKLTKRIKSPQTRRLSKKIKQTGSYEQEAELSDSSNQHSASENKSCILREIPSAENNITDIDPGTDDIKCVTSTNTSSISKNTSLVCDGKDSIGAKDHLPEVKETTAPIKRKSNSSKSPDIVLSKSKKTKYQKNKSQSDFDSDDDKLLLETKKNIPAEKKTLEVHGISNIAKEDNDAIIINLSDASNEQSNNAIAPSETRVTCYSRSISNKRPRSSSTSVKDHAQYDPYDFDFIDMPETTGPTIKKRSRTANNNRSPKSHHDFKLRVSRENLTNPSLKVLKEVVPEIQQDVYNESDSDSSKSDVPLQKYVDEKISKSDTISKNNKSRTGSVDPENTNKNDVLAPAKNSLDMTQISITENIDCNRDNKTHSKNSNTEASSTTSCKITKSTKHITSDSTCESNSLINDSNSANTNITSTVQASQKQSNKTKKKRRTTLVHNIESPISNEEDQQIRSDKFMEKFGFYSERMPRKSNLLASKKISETFHMISNESDESFFGYKEKSSKKSIANENKKKSEIGSFNTSQDSRAITDNVNYDVQAAEPVVDVQLGDDAVKMDDSDLDSLTAQAIMESEEVKSLENDLFSSLREAAKASAARNSFVGYQNTSLDTHIDTIAKDVDQNDCISQIDEKMADNLEASIKTSKCKQTKQTNVKDKMYPDIEEIDLLEDKFDKIKRKRRSQAVAAKQVQVVAETSAKSRKQSEKKKNTKNTKKNVPTKGALKGFEGIKIPIQRQDMPINISLTKQKKRRKTAVKRKKGTSDSDSTSGEFDDKDKYGLERDIYEFKDSEDTELFDLRPSTVMDRFRSMHNKHKHKDKGKDIYKVRNRDKERKSEAKDLISFETAKEPGRNTNIGNEKGQKKSISKEERRNIDGQRVTSFGEKVLEKSESMGSGTRIQKGSLTPSNYENDHDSNEVNSALASTSGFIPEQIDESDYESEMSSPEGDFIVYMSNDINCVCPSDNESDDSDAERKCGRLNCVYKNRNADKNAAIENIFKNNAVRCEKPEIKESEKPKPNLDQLFDSLLETESKSYHENSTIIETSNMNTESNISTSSPFVQHNCTESKDIVNSSLANKDVISILDESYNTTNLNQSMLTAHSEELTSSKSDHTSSFNQNDSLIDSDTNLQIFSPYRNPKENVGYSLMSEESTQVDFNDIIAHDSKSEANDKNVTNIRTSSTGVSGQLKNYNSEDEFDIDKPETLNKQYMHLILPAEKASASAQTENSIDNCDVEFDNESVTAQNLKAHTESVKMDSFIMTSAQNSQTGKSLTHDSGSTRKGHLPMSKNDNEIGMQVVPKSRVGLHKLDYSEKSRSSEKYKSKPSQCDAQADSDVDIETKKFDRADKKLDKGTLKSSKGASSTSLEDEERVKVLEDVGAFTAPVSKSTIEKQSPRKSDEGISTSHDCSADAFDQSFDFAGVARQRARRKCTVGKQNILAEHWSSESEFDSAPPRPNSADSVVASAPRKKKSKKKEGHHSSGKKTSRHSSKNESKNAKARALTDGRSDDSDACAGGSGVGAGGSGSGSSGGSSRAPPGPKMRARPAHHYWSSEGEESPGPQPQHGWIVGDSHKKLVTMLAHAKGRKRSNSDKHLD